MCRLRMFALAGAAALLATSALAADLPPPFEPTPTSGGWYLRGYIGQSNQYLDRISHPSFDTAPQFAFLDWGGFDSAPFYGAGVGYQWNNWFRTDVTGEYRGRASFHALDRFFNTTDGVFNTNDYTASKSEWVALVNAYIDLGTWWCITPFVGAGVGVAFNTIEHFRDTNVIAGGGGWAETGTKTQSRLGPARRRVLQGVAELRCRALVPIPECGQCPVRDADQSRSALCIRQSACAGHLPQYPIARCDAWRALDAAAGADVSAADHQQGLSARNEALRSDLEWQRGILSRAVFFVNGSAVVAKGAISQKASAQKAVSPRGIS